MGSEHVDLLPDAHSTQRIRRGQLFNPGKIRAREILSMLIAPDSQLPVARREAVATSDWYTTPPSML